MRVRCITTALFEHEKYVAREKGHFGIGIGKRKAKEKKREIKGLYMCARKFAYLHNFNALSSYKKHLPELT